jgi:hypothetical protein
MPDRDDKDRFGDTLHRKERGDEERYFAELDRQRLARIRDQAASGRCPRCGRTLLPAGSPRSAEACDGGCAG